MKHPLLLITLLCVATLTFIIPCANNTYVKESTCSKNDTIKGRNGQNKPHTPNIPISIPSI